MQCEISKMITGGQKQMGIKKEEWGYLGWYFAGFG
jgi:hypothetical protein